jgi:adenylate cyclase
LKAGLGGFDLSRALARPPRILVVDDDWFSRDLLRSTLAATGCEVHTACDGQEGLQLARRIRPDLALVDIHMPRLDGVALCEALKGEEATRFVPVIIVTALEGEAVKLRAIEAGADDFLAKPYSALVLLTRARSLLRIKRLHDELEARNRLLRRALDHYVSPDITEELLRDPERRLQLGGETRFVSVLFADIRNFTRYTEEHSGAQVVGTLNRIFAALSEVVFSHRGTLDKFLGDGLMAFFGAPLAGEDDAQRAVDCAIEMQHRFRGMRSAGGEELLGLDLGIGLHSGEAVVGNIGSEALMDYTVVGGVVNIAKRLQEKARGGEILISRSTYGRVRVEARRQRRAFRLPGRQKGMAVYAVRLAPCPAEREDT